MADTERFGQFALAVIDLASRNNNISFSSFAMDSAVRNNNIEVVLANEVAPNSSSTNNIRTHTPICIITQENECCICRNESVDLTLSLVPCGHASFCHGCIYRFERCPLCKRNISQILVSFR